MLFTINQQHSLDRVVLHALHYIPQRRGRDFDIVEDVIPLYDVSVSVRPPTDVIYATVEPEGETLSFKQAQSRVEFVIPQINGHQMVALELAED